MSSPPIKDKDITGQKFNRLTAIEIAGKYRHDTIWKFKCDCGNIVERRGWTVTTGHTKSCGCYSRERSRMSRYYSKGEAGFNIVLRDYRYRCKQKSIEFNLSKEEFRNLLLGNCFYCGIPPNRIRRTPTKTDEFIYNGIDRLDSNKGYSIENCVSCCTKCNTMKGTLSYGEFIELLQLICNRLSKVTNGKQ